MRLVTGICAVAGAIGLSSALSLACYAAEGASDTYPTGVLVGLAIAAMVQAMTSLLLILKRTLWSVITFLVVAVLLAALELNTTIGVHYVRNYLSTAATVCGVGVLVATAIESSRDRRASS